MVNQVSNGARPFFFCHVLFFFFYCFHSTTKSRKIHIFRLSLFSNHANPCSRVKYGHRQGPYSELPRVRQMICEENWNIQNYTFVLCSWVISRRFFFVVARLDWCEHTTIKLTSAHVEWTQKEPVAIYFCAHYPGSMNWEWKLNNTSICRLHCYDAIQWTVTICSHS